MAARRRASSPINPLGSLVFTAGVVLLGILLYASNRLLTEPQPQRWVAGPTPPVDEGSELPLAERIAAVTSRLERGPLRLPTPEVQPQGSGAMRYEHRRYELSLPRDDGGTLPALLELARAGDPSVVTGVDAVEDGQRGHIGVDGLLTHSLLVRWQTEPTPAPPRAAVVIDDMGNDLLVARDLLSLPFPVAIAVIPFRPFSREVAESAFQRGREVLLHLPMEAASGEEHGELELLRVSDNPNRIIEIVDRSLEAVPRAIGVSNHMGSRFTEDPERMRLVLERLHQRRLFFLDSRTTPRSAVAGVAKTVGVPYLARAVFLDARPDEAAVRESLGDLLAAAKRDGAAVGIGHPHPQTLAALPAFAEMARAQGVEIAPIAELVAGR